MDVHFHSGFQLYMIILHLPLQVILQFLQYVLVKYSNKYELLLYYFPTLFVTYYLYFFLQLLVTNFFAVHSFTNAFSYNRISSLYYTNIYFVVLIFLFILQTGEKFFYLFKICTRVLTRCVPDYILKLPYIPLSTTQQLTSILFKNILHPFILYICLTNIIRCTYFL